MTAADGPAITEDALLGGRVRLRQPARGHRAGTDAVLLAALSGARAGDRVLDLGSGSGAVGLMVAARAGLTSLTLVDRDPDLVRLARENIASNGLSGIADAICLDAFVTKGWPQAGSCDLVVTNPPFFEAGERVSPDAGRSAAHAMAGGDLYGWMKAAACSLRSAGRIALIHRADRLGTCLDAMRGHFGSIEVRPIYSRPNKAASRIFIRGVKASRGPDAIAPPLILHDLDGTFTAEAARMHRL